MDDELEARQVDAAGGDIGRDADARTAIAALAGTVEGGDADIAMLQDFLAAATRGIVR